MQMLNTERRDHIILWTTGAQGRGESTDRRLKMALRGYGERSGNEMVRADFRRLAKRGLIAIEEGSEDGRGCACRLHRPGKIVIVHLTGAGRAAFARLGEPCLPGNPEADCRERRRMILWVLGQELRREAEQSDRVFKGYVRYGRKVRYGSAQLKTDLAHLMKRGLITTREVKIPKGAERTSFDQLDRYFAGLDSAAHTYPCKCAWHRPGKITIATLTEAGKVTAARIVAGDERQNHRAVAS